MLCHGITKATSIHLYACSMKNVLVVDIGGTHVKVASTTEREPLKIPSGTMMTAKQMAEQVLPGEPLPTCPATPKE